MIFYKHALTLTLLLIHTHMNTGRHTYIHKRSKNVMLIGKVNGPVNLIENKLSLFL